MKNHELIIDDAKTQLQNAQTAAAAGEYLQAYQLLRKVWLSDFWSESSHDLLHFADASEQVGDFERALMIYTRLMESTTLDLEGATAALIQTSMERLHKKIKEQKHPVSTEKFAHAEISVVKKLLKIGKERTIEPNSFICKSGDIASHMWLLVEGEMDVQVSNISMDTLTGTDEVPCLIGEVAYFTGLRRAASLYCLTPVRVIEVSYHDLGLLELQDEALIGQLDLVFKSRLGMHLLRQHDLFKRLKEEEHELIATSFVHIEVEAGHILVEQNLPRDECFMVQSGTLMMLQENIFGEYDLVSSMHPGDIIHLPGLLKDFRPPYRIITGTACRLLLLKSDQFEPVLEENPWFIKEILKLDEQEAAEQILRPHKADLWAGNRNIDLAVDSE